MILHTPASHSRFAIRGLSTLSPDRVATGLGRHLDDSYHYVRNAGPSGMEPIGARIVETPESLHDAEILRNPRSGWLAYVPPGSLKKGEELVKNGTTASGSKVTACTVCHGPDLRGIGQAPTIAGRSPSYLGRQLYDMQSGNRNGAWTPLMVPVVASLNAEDLVNASAYLASLKP